MVPFTFTVEGVEEALQSMKEGRATRLGGIVADLIKCGGNYLLIRITNLLNAVMPKGQVPEQ